MSLHGKNYVSLEMCNFLKIFFVTIVRVAIGIASFQMECNNLYQILRILS